MAQGPIRNSLLNENENYEFKNDFKIGNLSHLDCNFNNCSKRWLNYPYG